MDEPDSDDAIHFVEVDAMPTDVSPYGVRGMAGNVMDWVRSDGPSGLRVGGSCAAGPLGCRVTHRMVTPLEQRTANTSFRIVRNYF